MHSQSVILSALLIASTTISEVSAVQEGGERVLIKRAFGGGHHGSNVGHHQPGQGHHSRVAQVRLILYPFLFPALGEIEYLENLLNDFFLIFFF